MENQRRNLATDPVCGMKVDPTQTNLVVTHYGRRYYFCAEACQKAFAKNPAKYLKPKGAFGLFLDRLARSNQKEFGRGGPRCH